MNADDEDKTDPIKETSGRLGRENKVRDCR